MVNPRLIHPQNFIGCLEFPDPHGSSHDSQNSKLPRFALGEPCSSVISCYHLLSKASRMFMCQNDVRLHSIVEPKTSFFSMGFFGDFQPFHVCWFGVIQLKQPFVNTPWKNWHTPRKTNECPLKINGWSRCINGWSRCINGWSRCISYWNSLFLGTFQFSGV